MSSILVTAKQYFGDPISCVVDKSIPQKVMDSYCWIESTFSLPDMWNKSVGYEVAYPGIGLHDDESEIKYHKYYQWVCFFLFGQALTFYAPRYLWKLWERNRMKNLVSNLRNPLLECADREKQQLNLLDYLKENFNRHQFYAYRFFICECLNFMNALTQIYLVDSFLDNEFSTYGSEVLSFIGEEQVNRVDPMVKIFPKLTKCTFRKYGASGSIEIHDGLCVLSLNIINEKIFIVLWFWLIFLVAASASQLIYRFIICFLPSFRFHAFRLYNRHCDYKNLWYIHARCDIGDWFILRQLGKNIDPLTYREIINKFVAHLKKKEEEKNEKIEGESQKNGCDEKKREKADVEAMITKRYAFK